MLARALLLFTSLAAWPLAAADALRTRESLPWNLIENGGFESDTTGLFAVGQAQRDRENPASGDASARFEIPAGKTTLEVRISSGLRLEQGRYYVVAGRMRTAFAAPAGEASVLATLRGVRGEVLNRVQAAHLYRSQDWRPFQQRIRGDGGSPLQFTLVLNGAAGDKVWLDDLFIGPAEVDLTWDAKPGSGLLQALVADGVQFEFPIPAQSIVMGVFRNGRRLVETVDCEVLHGPCVVRLFETPARGEHLAIVLRSAAGRAQMAVSPLFHYGLYTKAGIVRDWIPAPLENFKGAGLDYAVLEQEVIDLPSIDGLPTEFAADAPREIALKVHAPGRYSLRLRNANGLVRSLAEFQPLGTGGILRAAFNGCDDDGVPLEPGAYTWEVLHRPLHAFALKEAPEKKEHRIRDFWSSGGETSLLMWPERVDGKMISAVMRADANLKPLDARAKLPVAHPHQCVESPTGVFWYFEDKSLVRFEKDSARPLLDASAILGERGHGLLAPAAEGVWLAARDILKVDASGSARVVLPRVDCFAIQSLPDGGALVWTQKGLFALDASGRKLRVWRNPRGGPLSDVLETVPPDDLLAPIDSAPPKLHGRPVFDAALLRVAPTGEILLANRGAIQVYAPRGEYLTTLGSAPNIADTVRSQGYVRNWRERGRDFVAIDALGFDAAGELRVLDRGRGLSCWTFAPRISHAPLKIAAAPREAPAPRPFDPLPPAYALDMLKSRDGLAARVVDFRDLAAPGVCDDGTSSVLRRPGLRPYRLSGSEHCSWFSVTLWPEKPAAKHLLLVEYPDDAPRWTLLRVSNQSSAGYGSGRAQPLSGKDAYFTTLLRDRADVFHLVFASFHPGALPQARGANDSTPYSALTGAAASRVWLLEIEPAANTVEEPVKDRRTLSLAMSPDADGTARQEALAAWLGANELYLTPPLPRPPATLSCEMQVLLPDLSGIPPELSDFALHSEFGRLDPRNLCVAYPEVQAHFTQRVCDVAALYSALPKFQGVTLRLGKRAAPLFGGVEPFAQGFEPRSVQAYEAARGKTVPGASLQEKIAVLKGDGREDWTRWRCEVLAKWIFGVRDELKKLRPDLVLQLYAEPDARLEGFDPPLYAKQENIRLLEDATQEPLHDLLRASAEKWAALKPERKCEALVLRHGPAGRRMDSHPETSDFFVPGKPHVLAPLIAALIRDNPREIILQSVGNPVTGYEPELREFARAFRSLPHAPFKRLSGDVHLQAYTLDSEALYVLVANVSSEPKALRLSLGKAGDRVRNLVDARAEPVQADGENTAFDAIVPAGSIRTYRVGP